MTARLSTLTQVERAGILATVLADMPPEEARAVRRYVKRLIEWDKRRRNGGIGRGIGLEIMAAVGVWMEDATSAQEAAVRPL